MIIRKSSSPRVTRRGLAVLILGVGLLLALVLSTWLTRPHSSVQLLAPAITAQAGPYTLAVSVAPDPPQTSQITHLTFRVTDTSTGQSISDAGVELRGFMVSMDMLMAPIYASPQADGTYQAAMNLSMVGPWQLTVTITRSNVLPASTLLKFTSNSPT